MSDPLTTFDLVAIGAVVVALVAAVTALWKAFTAQVNELKKQAAETKAEMKSVVTRVRLLEDERVTEVRDHADKLASMNAQQMAVFSRAINALQEITKTVGEWHKRPCMASGEHEKMPTPLPEIDTETLIRCEAKIKKHQQGESSAS